MGGRATGRATDTARPPWRSRAVLGLGLVALLWLLACIVGSAVAARRLSGEIASRFAADVRVGAVRYWPPYWLSARDVVVRSELDGAPVDWIALRRLDASLAWWPLGGRVVLARLALHDPTVRVVRDQDGEHDPLDLWRGEPSGTPGLPVAHVAVDGARLLLSERTTSPSPPIALGAFTLRLDASDATGSTFACTLGGGDAQLAVKSAGTLDLARRTFALASLAGSVRLGGSGQDDAGLAASLSGAHGDVDLAARTARVEGGSLVLAGTPRLAFEDVHASLALVPGRLDATDAGARVAGGTIDGTLTLRWDGAPRWRVSGSAARMELAQLAPRFPVLGGRAVHGIVSGRGSLSGPITTDAAKWLDGLHGEGTGRAHDGRFYEVPLVAKLLQQSNFASQAATLSNAAAAFRLDARTIHLDNAALGSDSVGVQGHGDIGLDGHLALEMVVVPLGDWRAEVQRGEVPVVGDALASLAAEVQSLFGKASGLVYQFRVSGTVENPTLTPVPVPVLTRSAAAVFGRMVTTGWNDDVLGD